MRLISNIVEVGINYEIYFSVEHPLGVKLICPRHCKKSIFFSSEVNSCPVNRINLTNCLETQYFKWPSDISSFYLDGCQKKDGEFYLSLSDLF